MTNASTYENALQDMLSELNELLIEYSDAGEEVKRALMRVGGIIKNKFFAFELERPELTGPLAEPDIWYLGVAK